MQVEKGGKNFDFNWIFDFEQTGTKNGKRTRFFSRYLFLVKLQSGEEEGMEDEGLLEPAPAVCDVDGVEAATLWCDECTKLLCDSCDAKVHSESSGLQSHTRDPLGDEEVIEDNDASVLEGNPVLEMQEEEVLKWLDKEQDPYTVRKYF